MDIDKFGCALAGLGNHSNRAIEIPEGVLS
jgi:hypothetical protein